MIPSSLKGPKVTDHFRLWYSNAYEREVDRLPPLDQIYKTLRTWLGFSNEPITIYWVADRDQSKANPKKNLVSVFGENYRLRADVAIASFNIMSHEAAHVFIKNKSAAYGTAHKQALPMWLNEGLAQYAGYQLSQWCSHDRQEKRERLKMLGTIRYFDSKSLRDLMNKDRSLLSEAFLTLYEKLLERFGEDTFRFIRGCIEKGICLTMEGKIADEVSREIFAIGLKELEDWLQIQD